MMWVMASVPFWLAGGICLYVVGRAMRNLYLDTIGRQTLPRGLDRGQIVAASLLLLLVSGGLFIVAAKVAS